MTGREGPAVVELRQYALHAGQRDTLIDLFDSTFVESQEDVGIDVIGQFRDLDGPDRFIWLRGFADMEARARGLADFYTGPVWRAHRHAANATMVDSDNVLLLRPAAPGAGFMLPPARSTARSSQGSSGTFVMGVILYLEGRSRQDEVRSFFERKLAPRLVDDGGSVLSYLVTDPSENDFPALPVREGEEVFVAFAGFPDGDALSRSARREGGACDAARGAPGLVRAPEVLRLAPTARSLLGGRSSPCAAFAGLHPVRPDSEGEM